MRKKGEMEGHLLLLKDRSITGLNCFITCTPTATVHVVLKLIFINLEIECVLMYIMVIIVKELFSEKALFKELVQPIRQKRFDS